MRPTSKNPIASNFLIANLLSSPKGKTPEARIQSANHPLTNSLNALAPTGLLPTPPSTHLDLETHPA
ncbi:hypothetical protein Thermus77412_13230 [Thermus antranikianii]